jgi:hypothetical protein
VATELAFATDEELVNELASRSRSCLVVSCLVVRTDLKDDTTVLLRFFCRRIEAIGLAQWATHALLNAPLEKEDDE